MDVGELFRFADLLGFDAENRDLVDQFAERAWRRNHAGRRAPLRPRREFARHGFKHVGPDPSARLAKKAHGWIPGRIRALGHPAPFRVALERNPNWNSQS